MPEHLLYSYFVESYEMFKLKTLKNVSILKIYT